MIVGIGTDIVAVKRFESMQQFSRERLYRLFTEQELTYSSHNNGQYIPERLAARFAAKEACFKALSNLVKPGFSPSLLRVAPLVEVKKNKGGAPVLSINWTELELYTGPLSHEIRVHLSLSHEKEYAQAFVVIEQVI